MSWECESCKGIHEDRTLKCPFELSDIGGEPQPISLPGVPEGYRAVAWEQMKAGRTYLQVTANGMVTPRSDNTDYRLRVEPIEPPKPKTIEVREYLVQYHSDDQWSLIWRTDEPSHFHHSLKTVIPTGQTREVEVPV